MKGRPNIHRDEELVRKAQQLFWERGYSATSLSDLSKATGAGAGSLYNTFKGGKKELFRRSLQQRREALHAFERDVENSDNPVALLKAFFLGIADADTEAHLRGCIVANTVVEMTFVDRELEAEAIQLLQDTEALYTTIIRDAQKKGTIKSRQPADVLGKYLITFWCGLNSLRRIYPDRDILKQQIALQLQMID
ncbi:TetR/AcrR family transcriptional regulator [Sinomicrobium oceani]|uniref:TetR/AcrR family transcriptional regulator n=1 Tax=Sinomicrobium oceani TaxID=1150368 RepID=UPI00227A9516|nr:TetR/AcrR family transcriptional regulator [Sinomicrobium oceani]